MQKGGKRRNYVHCLPKDLRQRANLPQLINLLFAQIKSTWLEVCKKKQDWSIGCMDNFSIFTTGICCWNPAFDVTPADLITGGIITEKGVVKAPLDSLENLKTLELTLPK